jgi:hypothetical protein
MAGNPEYQNLDPMSTPSPITPHDSPGNAAGWAMVFPHGQGTAPYDIQEDVAGIERDITAVTNAAAGVSAAGVVYPPGTRQREARELLDSPAGFSAGAGLSGYDITAGWSGEPDESWKNAAGQPTTLLDTPIQGEMGTYPESTSTVQEGLQKYGTT